MNRTTAPVLAPMRVALVTGLVLLGATAPAAADSRLPITHYRLDNGLEVVLQPDPSVTSVVVHVRYHVGSKDEVTGKTGFAHLFEHLMFEGSKHVAEGAFDRMLETAGGWNNGTTDNDRTNYYEQVPGNFLDLALWLEADRMAGLWDAMNEKVLANQRDVVKNELRQSYQNVPYGMAELAIQQALWPPGHPNHNLTIGTMADLDAASMADVEAFWRTWYLPSNATLVVVGGFDLDATRARIQQLFGWMPAAPRPAGKTLTAPVEPLAEPGRLDLTDRVTVPGLILGYRIDAPTTAARTELAIAAHLLAGGKSSRLYRRLVMKDRLATDVGADVQPYVLGGELHLHVIAREKADVARIEAALRAEVAALRTTPVSAAELERARRTLEVRTLTSLEGLEQRADTLATWTAIHGDPDHLDEDLAALAAVTPASLQATASRWLADRASVLVVVRPAPRDGAPAAGGAQ
jgi:zinc protease